MSDEEARRVSMSGPSGLLITHHSSLAKEAYLDDC